MADSTETPLKKDKVPLKSSEGETFEIDIEAFLQCKTLRIMCDGRIPMTSNILSKVVEYCNKHASGNLGWPKSAAHGGGGGGDEVEEEEEELKRWDNEEFLKDVDHDTLYELFMAANELDIKSLAKLISPRLGGGKSSQEMMLMFIDEESKRMEKAEQVRIQQEKVIMNILKSFNEFCSNLALIIILILGNLFY